MNRFTRPEQPRPSLYAEAVAAGRAAERRNKRARVLFCCLLPLTVLAGWGAFATIGKFLK